MSTQYVVIVVHHPNAYNARKDYEPSIRKWRFSSHPAADDSATPSDENDDDYTTN